MQMDLTWSSLAWPGIEHARWTDGGELRADSLAVHALPDGPARIAYQLSATPDGHTRHVSINVVRPAASNQLVLSSDGSGAWMDAEGQAIPTLSGCLDVDISCTPLTNTLPIRRLGLASGASADILVAYVKIPDLELRAVTQRYTRLPNIGNRMIYRYKSGIFQADITVDEYGLVLDYPGTWHRASSRNPRLERNTR
jgi:uncharacterized protein